jgi:hypothetical protein
MIHNLQLEGGFLDEKNGEICIAELTGPFSSLVMRFFYSSRGSAERAIVQGSI